MTQFAFSRDFFEPRTLARSSDPITSHLAAESVATFAKGHHALILRALREHGPMTYHETAAHCGLDAHAVGKRCRELEVAGAIRVVIGAGGQELTRLSPSGRAARVWWAVAQQEVSA